MHHSDSVTDNQWHSLRAFFDICIPLFLVVGYFVVVVVAFWIVIELASGTGSKSETLLFFLGCRIGKDALRNSEEYYHAGADEVVSEYAPFEVEGVDRQGNYK